MTSIIRRISHTAILTAGTLLVCFQGSISAQDLNSRLRLQRDRNSDKKTFVSIVLLTDRNGLGLRAQQWQPVFNKLGVRVQIRRGTPTDKIETKELKVGTLRRVTAIGKLDRSGRLVFSDRVFVRSDAAKLVEWIRELETYGAQGAPDGKPLWGLSKTQFETVYNALSERNTANLTGKPLTSAVSRLNALCKLPIRFSADANRWLQNQFSRRPAVSQPVKNHSLGTTLALVLHDYGLGFHPQRTPAGKIELVISPLEPGKVAWPVGWEPKTLRSKIAPKMYQLIPVELKDVKLVDVLNAISIKTDVPIYLDRYNIQKKKIPIDTLKVSFARRKASWAQLLNGVTISHKLTRKFRIDERGQPLVWITPLVPTQPKR
ncbi:MAG: hypothetical protein Tsb009_07720 [Planctomycetaceae bacterium]